jgi:superfamily II DNA or RNA helicase
MGLSATITEKDTSVLNQFGKTLVAEYPIKKAMEDKVISEFNLLVIRAPIVMKKYIFGAEDHTLDFSTKIEYEYTSDDLKKAEEELEKALIPLKDIELDESEEFEPALLRLIRNRDVKFSKLARKYLQAKRQYDRVARSGKFEESILDILAPKIYQYGKTLVFSNSRAQGKSFAEELDSRKVTYIDGDTEQLGRKNAFTDLQESRISAVIAPMILDEGVNIPNAKIGIFLGPGREGYRQVIQRMGRVLRKKNEGERALLILVAGINTREDPGIDGERSWIRDSTFAVMSEHANEIRIVDFSDPTTIYEELDSLIELD